MAKYAHQPLTHVPYDPAWATLYKKEEGEIREKLGDYALRIEHIGSTAVPGLPAKPIIDILLVVSSDADAKECIQFLDQLDYEYMDKPDQYYLRKSTSETTGFHVHMTTIENKFWRGRIAFRDYLLNHPGAREKYAELKRGLIHQFGNDKQAYREGKGSFMAAITEKALAESPEDIRG